MTEITTEKKKCSKKWAAVSIASLIIVPVFVQASIINFAPASVAQFFLSPKKLREVIEYDQKHSQINAEKKAKKLIKSDIKNPKGNLLHSALDPVIGNVTDPAITIVEYIDYKCGYCKKANDEMKRILVDEKYKGKVRLIVKNYPVIGGEVSLYAAEVATGFFKKHPEKFLDLHSKLFSSELKDVKEVDAILAAFGEKGADLKTTEITDSIVANFNFAREIQISGTPAFVIGDELITGYATFEQLSAKIDEEMKK
jgi:protein-disulfide isomerase